MAPRLLLEKDVSEPDSSTWLSLTLGPNVPVKLLEPLSEAPPTAPVSAEIEKLPRLLASVPHRLPSDARPHSVWSGRWNVSWATTPPLVAVLVAVGVAVLVGVK